MFSYSAHLSIDMHCSTKLKKKIYILFNFSPPFSLKYSLSLSLCLSFSLCLLFLFVSDSRVSTSLFLFYLLDLFSLFFSRDRRWRGSMGFVNGVLAIGSVGFVDGVGRWVSWMAWVSGSAMAWVSGLAMA